MYVVVKLVSELVYFYRYSTNERLSNFCEAAAQAAIVVGIREEEEEEEGKKVKEKTTSLFFFLYFAHAVILHVSTLNVLFFWDRILIIILGNTGIILLHSLHI